MAQVDGGDLVARALKKEEVTHLFTLCGGHVAAIYDGCIDEGIKVIDTRHEQAAAHAADGWARITRRPGVALVTAGPGVTDAVTGVANAYQAASPMVLIGGRSPMVEFEMGSLQEMDHTEFMKPITKWSRTCLETRRIPEYISMAFRHATSGKPGPVFLEIPADILTNRVEESEVVFPEKYRTEARTYGDPAAVSAAARLLLQAERPMVMAGSAIWWCDASDSLRRLADMAKLPVYLNALGRGSLPPDYPYFFAQSRRAALAQADVVLIIGTPIDFRLGYGRPPRFAKDCKVIQVDLDAADIGRNRPIEVGIVGDTRAILNQLIDELSGRVGDLYQGPWLAYLRQVEEEAQKAQAPHLTSDAVPIGPLRLCHEIANFIDKGTIVVGDGGDIVSAAASVLGIYQPGHWVDPGPFGCLGVGTGFAIAAKLARPDKKVLIVNGDGSFGLNCMEFDTAVRFDIPIVSIIGNDGQWGQVTMGQVAAYGRDRVVASILGDARYEKVVEALGGHGEYVERPQDIRPALERAFASGKPACVNVKIDPNPPGVAGGRIPIYGR